MLFSLSDSFCQLTVIFFLLIINSFMSTLLDCSLYTACFLCFVACILCFDQQTAYFTQYALRTLGLCDAFLAILAKLVHIGIPCGKEFANDLILKL